MKIINKKLMLIVVLIGILSSIFIWKNISDKETKLEMVSLNNETKQANMFAIMLEQEDGTYKESEEDTWPTSVIYMYDEVRSGCIDSNGNKIENALMYDSENKIASVETSNTSYCYLYFSIPKICETGTKVGECLLENPTLALNTNMEGGLYRYQGSVANNYICFGTSDTSECLNNKDKYLYRIIGITEEGNLKLIKNSSLGGYAWHSTNENIVWPQSDLYKGLNGIEQENITPIFIDNETYDYVKKDSEWYNKIASVDWKYGDSSYNGNYNAETIYAIENGWTDTINAKVGLMYIHDYYYAYGQGGNPGTYTEAKTSWLFLNNHEWCMTYYGKHGDSYYAWRISLTGQVGMAYAIIYPLFVRPVLYTTSTIQYNHGLGTIEYPFAVF